MTTDTTTAAPAWTPSPWPEFKVGIISRADYERAKPCVDLCANVPAKALDRGHAIALRLPLEFLQLCHQDRVSPETVLRGFIGDLCGIRNMTSEPREDGYSSNGSDERNMADDYYRRCWYQWHGHRTRIDEKLAAVIEAQKEAAEAHELVRIALKVIAAWPPGSDEHEQARGSALDCQDEAYSLHLDVENAFDDWKEEVKNGYGT